MICDDGRVSVVVDMRVTAPTGSGIERLTPVALKSEPRSCVVTLVEMTVVIWSAVAVTCVTVWPTTDWPPVGEVNEGYEVVLALMISGVPEKRSTTSSEPYATKPD